MLNTAPAVSGTLSYTGSEFAYTVQAFLRNHLDTKESFSEAHRSKFRQQCIKEVKVGLIGPGRTFGDIDAMKNRDYMYTLRTASSDCVIYELETHNFLLFIKGHGKDV